jgi:Fic family protein
MEPDVTPSDRNEHPSSMEPLLLALGSSHRGLLTDLAIDLASQAAGFRRSLPESILESLADLVRSMNCYYSNLIEGHDTHPIDIERALNNNYSQDPRKRDLQVEALAHIAVQKWIDQGGLAPGKAVTVDGIREIHERFCKALPDEMLWVLDPVKQTKIRVEPGKLRHRDVQVR